MNKGVLEIVDNNDVILSLEEKFSDGEFEISVKGKLVNEVAYEFEDEIMAALSVCTNLVVDLSSVEYIASSAMATLLSVQQEIDKLENASLKISNPSNVVKEIFDESGFRDILLIEE